MLVFRIKTIKNSFKQLDKNIFLPEIFIKKKISETIGSFFKLGNIFTHVTLNMANLNIVPFIFRVII